MRFAKVGRKLTSNSDDRKLGTFAGVFTPSVLTILGIILFLRLGYVVGASGLAVALVVIVLANTLSILTSLSLSAIATNLRVKEGGDYYLISRTLGLGFGGALGLVLFLAQSLSIGFYAIGFGEALANTLGFGPGWIAQAIAAGAVAALFVLAWAGADWATRFQYIVMALLVASLAAFGWGAWHHWHSSLVHMNFARASHAIPFWTAFAIFFPAVTGFTQGVSMSGDLKDTGRSIPRGTLAAVLLSFAIYVVVAILFAGSLPNAVLAKDYSAMKLIAYPRFLVDAGVIAATLSSALASFMGAPRILRALAQDKIFPLLSPFIKTENGNPRRAIILAGTIALLTTAVGNLNLIASIVSMFFLISYGLLNYATYFEARISSPFFRPTFRLFDRRLSLLGAAGCFGAMIMIDVSSAVVAAALMFAIVQYIRVSAVSPRWADSRRSYYLHQVQENLFNAAKAEEHARDWRPVLLVFTESAERREQVLRFSSWVAGTSGLMMVCKIIVGEPGNPLVARDEAIAELDDSMKSYGVRGFPLAVVTPDLDVSLASIVQSAGIGPTQANTVVVNWSEAPLVLTDLRRGRYSRNLRMAFRLGCNLLVLDATQAQLHALTDIKPGKSRIDVWWSDDQSSELCLLLAYLMTRDPQWSQAVIRILAVTSTKENREQELKVMLEAVRISAGITILANTSEFIEQSRESSFVFVPIRLRGGHFLTKAGIDVDNILSRLPATILVAASQTIDLDTDPDEGIGAWDEAESSPIG